MMNNLTNEARAKFVQTERHKITHHNHCSIVEHNMKVPKHHAKFDKCYTRVFYLPFGVQLRGTVQHHNEYTVITINEWMTPSGYKKLPQSKWITASSKCNPEDSYDWIKGVQIAWERCSVKIAQKFITRGGSICESLAAIRDPWGPK